MLRFSPNFTTYFSLFVMYGNPLGPFVFHLNIAFISRMETSNSNWKLRFWIIILIQISIWSLFSKFLFEFELPFRILIQFQIWSFISELLVVFDVFFWFLSRILIHSRFLIQKRSSKFEFESELENWASIQIQIRLRNRKPSFK